MREIFKLSGQREIFKNEPTIGVVFVACGADGPKKWTPRTAGQGVIFS
jgi:hypothetical protein